MAFYDSVKDKVRKSSEEDQVENSDEDTAEQRRGDEKVAFEQLKENSKDRETDLEPEDESTIEDLSSGGLSSGKEDYGDLSSIEIGDRGNSQAGKHIKKEEPTESKIGGSENSRHQVGIKDSSSTDKKEDSSESSPKEVLLTADGTVEDPEDKDMGEAGNTEVGLLRDIRDQNSEIIDLLREIRNSL